MVQDRSRLRVGLVAAAALGSAAVGLLALRLAARLRACREAAAPASHIELPDGLPAEVRAGIDEGLAAGDRLAAAAGVEPREGSGWIRVQPHGQPGAVVDDDRPVAAPA